MKYTKLTLSQKCVFCSMTASIEISPDTPLSLRQDVIREAQVELRGFIKNHIHTIQNEKDQTKETTA